MSGLATITIIGLGGLIVGLVFGAVSHRTNFCTMGGISDLVLMGDGRRFRAWVLATAVAIIGTQALDFTGAIDIDKSIYLGGRIGWLGAIIGGLMFGFGMTQTGGCAGKMLVRLGGGNLKSLVVFMVLGVFAYMTLRGLLAPLRVQIDNASGIDLAAHGLRSQNIGAMLAALFGIEPRTGRVLAAAALAAALLVFCFGYAGFRRSVTDVTAGLLIGATAVGGWVVTGIIAADEFSPVPLVSLTFVGPIGETLVYLMTFTGSTLSFGIAAVGGVIVGSFLMSVFTGSFRVETFADRNDLLRHLGGAALMGAGGVLALGCSIGQGITGMSTLSLNSLIAWLSILGGAYLGMKYLEEGSMGGALRAVFARG